MRLVPAKSDDAESKCQIMQVRDILNQVSAGALQSDSAQVALQQLEQDIRKRHDALRSSAFKKRWKGEAVPTFIAALTLIALYNAIYYLEVAFWFGDEASVTLHVVENIIGATGWGLLGFFAAIMIRSYSMFRYSPIEKVSAYMNETSRPWLIALENTAFVMVALIAIYFGISFIDIISEPMRVIALPKYGLVPGLVVGFIARSRFRDLADS